MLDPLSLACEAKLASLATPAGTSTRSEYRPGESILQRRYCYIVPQLIYSFPGRP